MNRAARLAPFIQSLSVRSEAPPLQTGMLEAVFKRSRQAKKAIENGAAMSTSSETRQNSWMVYSKPADFA